MYDMIETSVKVEVWHDKHVHQGVCFGKDCPQLKDKVCTHYGVDASCVTEVSNFSEGISKCHVINVQWRFLGEMNTVKFLCLLNSFHKIFTP